MYFVIVEKKGRKIQFRLKHDLNKPVTAEDLSVTRGNVYNVIELAKKRREQTSATVADSAQPDVQACKTPRFHNLGVNGSQVIGFGRGYRARTDDIHLVRVALYQLS